MLLGAIKHPFRTVLKFILGLIILAVLALVAINAYVIGTTRDDVHTIYQLEADGTSADAILVLGASVYSDGTPSDILADRLEMAVDLYFAGIAPAIIVSGDNSDSHYNESDAMKDYCVSLGVPDEAVYVDHAGYDTYASVFRAKYIFGADSIVITTQAYHLYRALCTAEGLGMTAYGVASDKGEYENQTLYSAREIFARTKDVFQTLFGVVPKDAFQPITNT